MEKVRNYFLASLVLTLLLSCNNGGSDQVKEGATEEEITYQENWESLQNYEVPEWFQDAKLGIFIHLG